MATGTAKRRITVWALLVVLLVLTALSGCKKKSETPAPMQDEPNSMAAEPNA